jgi:GNAT superfamily N-acetyltransferase
VFGLLKSAAQWLHDRDIDYWQNWLDPPAHHVRWVDEGLAASEFRIIESAGSVIGCVRLLDSDPLFWGEREDSAVYVHSFTVDRALAGHGIGACVLEVIEGDLAARGVGWLRLDCGEAATGLRRYYESVGFHPVGETVVDGERLVLYQKAVIDREQALPPDKAQ